MSLSTTNKLVEEMSALRGTTQANNSKEEENVNYKESHGPEKVKQATSGKKKAASATAITPAVEGHEDELTRLVSASTPSECSMEEGYNEKSGDEIDDNQSLQDSDEDNEELDGAIAYLRELNEGGELSVRQEVCNLPFLEIY